MKRKRFGKILLAVIGAAFLLWGLSDLILGVFGQKSAAVVTSVRRQGGERSDMKPGRYTYQIGYSFTVPSGRRVEGTYTQIGDGVYQKADGTKSIDVRYFPAAPFINAPEANTRLSARQPVLLAVGALLLVIAKGK